jgi:hypothetical protein
VQADAKLDLEWLLNRGRELNKQRERERLLIEGKRARRDGGNAMVGKLPRIRSLMRFLASSRSLASADVAPPALNARFTPLIPLSAQIK